MSELSVFVDESGNTRRDSKYYLLTLVFHEQAQGIAEQIDGYESILKAAGLQDIPLHIGPLLRGNEAYDDMETKTRGKYLSYFRAFASRLPFNYVTFAYEKRQFNGDDRLFARMRRDLVLYLYDKLEYFQSFDIIKIYYDNGQDEVTKVLHSGFEYALGKQTIVYRTGKSEEYRLQQVADYACGVELSSLKYEVGEQSKTDAIFFGTRREFIKNHLKQLRKKRLE